ncbi:MAG: hypothetical protein CMF62_01120 [Magnetococcales bacterium]|nr:hypothetical protein [Magnetococcales bacterium]|tara:strand:+ start:4902 stop:5639 length:738 start_codon:yes stop_codon:yes gene_type:complete
MKIIILIISETGKNKRLDSFKSDWEVYMNSSPDIKCFFIEYRNQDEEIIESENYIYVKGEEKLIPNIFYKSLKSIQYINEKYKYDFLLRTNLGTKFNFANLIKLYDKLPRKNYYSGVTFKLENNKGVNMNGITKFDKFDNSKKFAQGICIFMSRDVVKFLLSNYKKNTETINSYDDDIAIGLILNKKYKMRDISLLIKSFEKVSKPRQIDIINDLDNYIGYRIKNKKYPNRDISVSKELVKKIYQ